jgi:hypothetical protein
MILELGGARVLATVNLNLKIDAESNRILELIKAVYGLSNKAEALEKLIHESGVKLVEPELREEFVAEVLRIDKEHERKYGFKRKRSLAYLHDLLNS